MKKNIMMRLSALLLVAVLLTTCVISGTFAKYVSNGSAGDEARVAKWGVTVTVTGDEAFGEKYNNAIEVSGTKVVSINAADDAVDDNVLAPGTNGNLGSVAITGTPEVYVTVLASLDIELTGWTVEGAYYCPLDITVGSNTINGMDYASMDLFEAAIEALVAYEITAADADDSLDGYQVAANTDLAYSVSINWAWAFHTSEANDILDSKLGSLAVAPTIAAEWTASVTQVD